MSLMACDSSPTDVNRHSDLRPLHSISASAVDRPGERQFNRLAARLPDFAGYYLDQSGDLHVVLTALADTVNARPMLQDVLVALPRTTDNPRQIVFELGRYSFKQLASWRDDLTHFGFARIPVMHSIDVQESTNRIEVKVSVPEGVDDVRNVVTWLGIPTEAVSVRVEPADHDYADSLTKFKTPFAGGLKILQYANRQPCSIGFNTFAGTEFVTASHCTRVIGPDYPTLANFFQPDTTGLFIGSESDDASTFTDETGIYECPAFQQCRWSDAARVAYKSGFEPGAAGGQAHSLRSVVRTAITILMIDCA